MSVKSKESMIYLPFSFIHSFIFAFNKKYNNSIQKYIKDNIRTIFQLNYNKIKYGKGKEAYLPYLFDYKPSDFYTN